MMFFTLGFLLLIVGLWYLQKGLKRHSHETTNGAIAMVLAGFFLVLWGTVLFLTKTF